MDEDTRLYRRMIGHAAAAYGATVLWTIVVLRLIGYLLEKFDPENLAPDALSSAPFLLAEPVTAQYGRVLTVIIALVLLPLVEEVLFRYFPLTLARKLGPAENAAIIIAVCGIGYGWLAGNMLLVLTRGALGAALGCLFYAHRERAGSAYLLCVAVHMLYNFTFLMLE